MSHEHRRDFKNAIFEQFARIPKALAAPKRLELIDLLAQGERTVEELANEAAMSVANTSQHLQKLRAAHLVEVRREGLYAYYRLASTDVFALWQSVRSVGEAQLAEVNRVVKTYRNDREALEAISITELRVRLDQGGVLLLDVRPEVEYRAGHILGALSVPIDELAERLDSLPEGDVVVAYCRGPYCVYADEAVALLNTRGFVAQRLAQGFPEWQAAGLPVSH